MYINYNNTVVFDFTLKVDTQKMANLAIFFGLSVLITRNYLPENKKSIWQEIHLDGPYPPS